MTTQNSITNFYVGLLLVLSLSAQSQVLPIDTFQTRWQQTPAPQLIDVRTPAEFSEGHLPKARNLNVQGTDFAAQVATLDKAKPVFVYCLSGGRTKKAAELLRASGYGPVYELDGGYLKWTMRMKPVEGLNRSAPATAALTPAQLTQLTTANSVVLVDVFAPWCGPCKQMMPTVEKLRTEYAGKAQIITVNADQAKALLTAYQVEEIPTLLLFRQGKLVDRQVGYRDEAAVRQLLNQQ